MLYTFVYAKWSYWEHKSLSSNLEGTANLMAPWIIIGNFNCIREDGKMIRVQPRASASMEDCNHCIKKYGVVELKHFGGSMSWFNGHAGNTKKWARLDRVLVNLFFLNAWQFAKLNYLEHSTSDHKPMLVQLVEQLNGFGPSPFRFQNMWLTHSNFIPIMQQVRSEDTHGIGLIKLAAKLKKSKLALKKWYKVIFGRVDVTIHDVWFWRIGFKQIMLL